MTSPLGSKINTEKNMKRKENQSIQLIDGRQLGYAEFGSENGIPVFYFHGAATSRKEMPFDEQELVDKVVKVICTDRPGHGLSDFQPNRKLLDWPEDIRQLVENLSIEKFYAIGYSHGGPYVLACCLRLPEKVVAGSIVSGWAPPNRSGAYKKMPIGNRILNGSARYFPWLNKRLRKMMMNMFTGDVQEVAQKLLASIPESDKEILASDEVKENLTVSVREGFRNGWEGIAHDDVVVNQNWGFDIRDIQTPLEIWHGQLDVNMPYHAAEYLDKWIPNSHLTAMPDEGHFIMIKHSSKVLSSLVGAEISHNM
jgi:pimeloyl-ACP methyl ester carboxylesterase